MPIELTEDPAGRWLELRLSGRLSAQDYEQFASEADRLIRARGTLDLLCVLVDFRGWEMDAALEDLKFGVLHFCDIRRIAMVGERRWHAWARDFCRPFSEAQVRCFEYRHEPRGEGGEVPSETARLQSCREAARQWLASPGGGASGRPLPAARGGPAG